MSAVVYDKISLICHTKDAKPGPLTVDLAKKYLGWESESETIDAGGKPFGKDFFFKDLLGDKVRLTNNTTNRPFRMGVARRYANEILRKKWSPNGENIIIDRKGKVQDGQHRLVGLIFASQLLEKDPESWSEYSWRGGVVIETTVCTGISERPEVVDTINLGVKRTLGDVIFRNKEMGEVDTRTAKTLSNLLGHAIRLVWLRSGGMTVSDAPHFPHSEALDFFEYHPRIKESLELVHTLEQGSERSISKYLSLGYAAGLHYLMAVAKTDPDKYMTEGTVNDSLWKKSTEFWTIFASGENLQKGNPILSLRNCIGNISASGGKGRDEICGTVIKAWNAWIEGQKVETADIKVKKRKEDGVMVLAETPRIGGIDVEREDVAGDDEEGEETVSKSKSKKAKKETTESAPEITEDKFFGKRVKVQYEDDKSNVWEGTVGEKKNKDGSYPVLADADGTIYDVFEKEMKIIK